MALKEKSSFDQVFSLDVQSVKSKAASSVDKV